MNSTTQSERIALAFAELASIEADCSWGFSAVLPAHRRTLLAYLEGKQDPEAAAYARALLLKVDAVIKGGLVEPASSTPGS